MRTVKSSFEIVNLTQNLEELIEMEKTLSVV